MMKYLYISILVAALGVGSGLAQQNPTRAVVVSSCGAQTLTAGSTQSVTMSVDGTLCTGTTGLSSNGNDVTVDANGAMSVVGPVITYSSSMPTLTNGQTANDWPVDEHAGMYVVIRPEHSTGSAQWFHSTPTAVNGTTEQDIVVADASFKTCISWAVIANSDATNSEALVLLDNGAIGTGTALVSIPAKAAYGNDTPYTFNPPLCTSAVNHKITADSAGSANAVTVTVGGYKAIQ